jgi:hypothetical protein
MVVMVMRCYVEGYFFKIVVVVDGGGWVGVTCFIESGGGGGWCVQIFLL